MAGKVVADTWFANIWKKSCKSMSMEPEGQVLGIMAFEISKLMSKVVSLWQSLADKKIVRLREEIANSVGIRKLVSENEDYLMTLVFSEIIVNLKSVTSSVTMLGKKCTNPTYHNIDRIFNEEDEIDPSWRFKSKEMEKKVKKMERFLVATEQLYQELEVLAELEQSLRRMRANSDSGRVELLDFQQKVMRQCQEVKNLREMSPWIRTYDYIVRLLLRSIFTIIEWINIYDQRNINSRLIRSNSFRRTSVYLSEKSILSYAVPLGRSFSRLGLGGQKGISKNVKNKHGRSQSTIFSGKQYPEKGRLLTTPVVESCTDAPRKNDTNLKDILYDSRKKPTRVSLSSIKSRPLDPPPSTLGYAALALRYANIIILIEKLTSSPYLISLDAKDDLYTMLPATIRSCLRSKLKTFSISSRYNSDFADEWSFAIVKILEWLSPLAHDTVRWQSERNFGRQRLSLGSGVRLVQTLYFASQIETEAAIVELLVGLNYLYRFGRGIDNGSLGALMLYRD